MEFIKRLFLFFRAFTRHVKRDKVRAHSAEAAFFIIMSFFPILMLMLTLLQFTPLEQETVLQILEQITPFDVTGALDGVIDGVFHPSKFVLSWTAIVALWTAGKGMMGVSDGLNSIYHVSERKNYFVIRIRSACYTFVLILALIVSLGILVFGFTILRYLEQMLPVLEQHHDILIVLPTAIAMAILVFLFAIMYTFLPNRRMPFLKQLPGALFTALAWTVFSYAFSIYIELSVNMSLIYGSLTTLIVAMLWLYICMYLLFIGAEVNDYLDCPSKFYERANKENYSDNIERLREFKEKLSKKPELRT